VNDIDERKGRPSASKFESIKLCPAKLHMEKGRESVSSAAAQRGTKIHAWLEDNESTELNHEDTALGVRCEDDRDKVFRMVWPDYDESKPHVENELRLWYRGNRYSGMADFVAHRDGHYVIGDYKTGPIKVSDAGDNPQLDALTALVINKFKPDTVTRCIIQPLCGQPTLHTITGKREMAACRRRCLDILRRAESKDAALVAGERQCKYCLAKEECPALREKMYTVAKIGKVEALTTTQMVEVMDALPAVKDLCKALELRAKGMLEKDSDALKGWTLRNGSNRRTVADTEKAIETLIKSNLVDAKGVMSVASIPIGKLERAVCAHTGLSSMEARQVISDKLGDIIKNSTGVQQLCRTVS